MNQRSSDALEKLIGDVSDLRRRLQALETQESNDSSFLTVAGVTGGRSIVGGNASGDDLTLTSTSHATKGDILMATTGGRVAIGTTTPATGVELDVIGDIRASGGSLYADGPTVDGLNGMRIVQGGGDGYIDLKGPGVLYFRIDNVNGGTTRMTLRTTGLEVQGLGVVGESVFVGKTIYDRTDLTIASDAITVTRTYHRVDTQGGAGTDNLATIGGMVTGQIVILSSAASARDVVVKHGTGNIFLANNTDFTLGDSRDHIMLICTGGEINELSRSKNS